MSERWWRWARPLGGAAILVVVVAQFGSAPFRDALQALDVASLGAGAVICVATTACAAWRWRLISQRLELDVSMSAAMAAYYRSQFLNLTLPGGVMGDVDRGLHHGREVGDVPRALRAVGWERAAGQLVLAASALVALLLLGSVASVALLAAGAVVTTAALGLAVVGLARHGRRSRLGRVAGVAAADARALRSPRVLLAITVASLFAVSGHVATFVVAARAVGVGLTFAELVAVAVLVLLVASVPLNLAGWGPREGAAAWVFAAVGAPAAEGLAVAVAFGAIVLVAALPGLVVILTGRSRKAAGGGSAEQSRPPVEAAGTEDAVEVATHG